MATRKIHFFTGKGGVGKSTLAAAYALRLSMNSGSSSAPEKILLTELSERPFYPHFFNQKGVDPGSSFPFKITQWSPDSCLKEYALHLLKIESLYKLFFQNPVSKSLIQIAPGLQELAILGKATSGPRKHGPVMPHDQVVIDAMSSGHFLALLRAPKAMAEIISFGPMGEQSRSIDKWIRDVDFTTVHVVSTSEDYAITEALELCDQLHSEFGMTPKIYLNKTLNFSDAFAKKVNQPIFSDLLDSEADARKRIAKTQFELSEIPFFPKSDAAELVRDVKEALTNA